MSAVSFSSLGLKTEIQENLETLGYLQPTPIQDQSLPTILAGKDLIAQAQTGSGKTAAFGLGLLNRLQVADFTIQALVLCPTRELADQVAREIRRLGRSIANIKVLTLCGGVPVYRQVKSLTRSPHIVVGTPGRVEDLLRKGHLRLQGLQTLVLDEADRMLDMGFQPALDAIIQFTPSKRQTLLFSATYPEQIDTMARRVMVDAVKVEINREMSVATIDQHFYRLEGTQDRFTALLRL
ncbi:MAG: DEAD/DEAH box helicase, partial [Gammaproteobacteria bacterium]